MSEWALPEFSCEAPPRDEVESERERLRPTHVGLERLVTAVARAGINDLQPLLETWAVHHTHFVRLLSARVLASALSRDVTTADAESLLTNWVYSNERGADGFWLRWTAADACGEVVRNESKVPAVVFRALLRLAGAKGEDPVRGAVAQSLETRVKRHRFVAGLRRLCWHRNRENRARLIEAFAQGSESNVQLADLAIAGQLEGEKARRPKGPGALAPPSLTARSNPGAQSAWFPWNPYPISSP